MKKIQYNIDYHQDHTQYDEFMEGPGSLNRMEAVKKLLPKTLATLTDKQRQYISDYFYGGLSTSEIAQKYGIERSTVSRTIKRGLKKMNQLVNVWDIDGVYNLYKIAGKRRRKNGVHEEGQGVKGVATLQDNLS